MCVCVHTHAHTRTLTGYDERMTSDGREKMASVSDMYDVSWEGKLKRRMAQDIHNESELQ